MTAMLIQTYRYAVENREELLKPLDSIINRKFYESAEKAWIEQEPNAMEERIAAIDSSWNYVKFQGYYLYAVECVSVFADNSFVTEPLCEVGLDTMSVNEGDGKIAYNPSLWLQSKGMSFEYELAIKSLDSARYVLVDGSLLARYYDRRQRKTVEFYEHARELMNKENLIFVAKTSESNAMLGGTMGDIHYFNRATKKAGYSRPYYDSVGITIFYARLDDYEPCLKVEVPGKLSEDQCRRVFGIIGTKRFNGYPYCLRLAHQRCKLTIEDMERLSNVLGLDIEPGERKVLNE